MLERLASDEVQPCIECVGLVGAGRPVPPHAGLLRAEAGDRRPYICLKCGVVWQVGHLGWARVVRSPDRAV